MRFTQSLYNLALTRPAAHYLPRPSEYIRCLPSSKVEGQTEKEVETLSRDFRLYPSFFNEDESRRLLVAGLWKLDRADSVRKRRRRGFKSGSAPSEKELEGQDRGGLQGLFEGEYGFEEGHFDSVIHDFRESLLTTLPPTNSTQLIPLLNRIYALLPTSPQIPLEGDTTPSDALTHVLHLAPHGEILPHVDHVEASGGVIVGISLGAERVLRLVRKGDRTGDGEGGKDVGGRDSDGEGSVKDGGSGGNEGEARSGWEVRLQSGSLYVQRDTVRYEYEHSILPYDHEASIWDGKRLESGHRISIMVRDAPQRPAQL